MEGVIVICSTCGSALLRKLAGGIYEASLWAGIVLSRERYVDDGTPLDLGGGRIVVRITQNPTVCSRECLRRLDRDKWARVTAAVRRRWCEGVHEADGESVCRLWDTMPETPSAARVTVRMDARFVREAI
jgi:hypothetical protein